MRLGPFGVRCCWVAILDNCDSFHFQLGHILVEDFFSRGMPCITRLRQRWLPKQLPRRPRQRRPGLPIGIVCSSCHASDASHCTQALKVLNVASTRTWSETQLRTVDESHLQTKGPHGHTGCTAQCCSSRTLDFGQKCHQRRDAGTSSAISSGEQRHQLARPASPT